MVVGCKTCLRNHDHRVRRALLEGVRANSHTQGIVTGELFVWRKVNKNRTDARTALVTLGGVVQRYCCWQREEQRVCVLSWSTDERCTRNASERQALLNKRVGTSQQRTRPCSERHSIRKTSRGKNLCSMNPVNFMNLRRQTRRRDS